MQVLKWVFNHEMRTNQGEKARESSMRSVIEFCVGHHTLLVCEHGAHRSAGTGGLVLTAAGSAVVAVQ